MHRANNFLKLAFRSLSQNKFFSFINLLGLSISIAVCLLIVRYVEQEYSYDQFHEKSSSIYRLHKVRKTNEVDTRAFSQTPYRLADELKLVLPDVSFLRISKMKELLSYDDQHFVEDGIMVADSNIVDFFTFDFMAGDAQSALNAPNSIVLTSAFAKKYFKEESPIGKTIQIGEKRSFLVKGVIKEFPVNSHLHFDCIIPMQALKGWYSEGMFNNLGSTWIYTYALTPEGMPAQQLKAGIQQLLDIRKVLGASVSELLQLLMKNFLKWVVLAFIIASPIIYFLMNEWLSGFAFKVSIGWQVYVFSGMLTVLISTFTVLYQSMRTALVNPANMLRSE